MWWKEIAGDVGRPFNSHCRAEYECVAATPSRSSTRRFLIRTRRALPRRPRWLHAISTFSSLLCSRFSTLTAHLGLFYHQPRLTRDSAFHNFSCLLESLTPERSLGQFNEFCENGSVSQHALGQNAAIPRRPRLQVSLYLFCCRIFKSLV